MDSPLRPQQLLTNNERRRSSDSNSPEFEFWMLRNPSFPEPHLLSADELFFEGVLLPLHLLHLHNNHHHSDPPPDSQQPPPPPPPNSQPEPEPAGPQISYQNPADSIANTPLTSSKRWKDIIFKKPGKKTSAASAAKNQEQEMKEKKKEKKGQSGTSSSSSSAELNINIWPFSRSRSAGNSGTRPRLFSGGAPTTRKVSSAPCSRSNSAGESKTSRKWPSSPSRAGVHLGRSSPVWQVRRRGAGGSASKNSSSSSSTIYSESVNLSSESRKTSKVAGAGGNSKSKVVNLNVPNMCIRYKEHLSCRSHENSRTAHRRNGSGGGDNNNSSTNFFNLRSLFSKKVY